MWDALEEAIRWWSIDRLAPSDGFPDPVVSELPWNDPDPLRSSIERLLAAVGPAGTTDGHALSDVLTSALEVWVDQMAKRYNDGHHFALSDVGIAGVLSLSNADLNVAMHDR